MKIAAIDLGTNTFHLIIAETLNGEMKILYKANCMIFYISFYGMLIALPIKHRFE